MTAKKIKSSQNVGLLKKKKNFLAVHENWGKRKEKNTGKGFEGKRIISSVLF